MATATGLTLGTLALAGGIAGTVVTSQQLDADDAQFRVPVRHTVSVVLSNDQGEALVYAPNDASVAVRGRGRAAASASLQPVFSATGYPTEWRLVPVDIRNSRDVPLDLDDDKDQAVGADAYDAADADVGSASARRRTAPRAAAARVTSKRRPGAGVYDGQRVFLASAEVAADGGRYVLGVRADTGQLAVGIKTDDGPLLDAFWRIRLVSNPANESGAEVLEDAVFGKDVREPVRLTDAIFLEYADGMAGNQRAYLGIDANGNAVLDTIPLPFTLRLPDEYLGYKTSRRSALVGWRAFSIVILLLGILAIVGVVVRILSANGGSSGRGRFGASSYFGRDNASAPYTFVSGPLAESVSN